MASLMLLVALLVTVNASFYPFDNTFNEKSSAIVAKDPKRLLSCMARCIDSKVVREMDRCQAGLPIINGAIDPNEKRRYGDQLVTMTKYELYEIVKCVSQSRNRQAQRAMDRCNSMEPQQTVAAYQLCVLKIIGQNVNPYDAYAAKPPLILEVFECVRQNTVKYTPKEVKQEISFENCARNLYRKTCGDKSYPYPS